MRIRTIFLVLSTFLLSSRSEAGDRWSSDVAAWYLIHGIDNADLRHLCARECDAVSSPDLRRSCAGHLDAVVDSDVRSHFAHVCRGSSTDADRYCTDHCDGIADHDLRSVCKRDPDRIADKKARLVVSGRCSAI